MPVLIPNAEAFFWRGDRTGCLLVHGFTASPNEMRGLGKHLAEEGYTVLGVRLAGHGTTPKDMRRTRWQDWMADVEDGWQQLQPNCERVFLAGLSMGGALCLLFASQVRVAGVVAMSTPWEVPASPVWITLMPLAPLISLVYPYRKKGPGDWLDPHAQVGRIAYPVNPTRSIYELDRLLKEMRRALPKVGAPTLLIHSRDDTYVPWGNMERIHAALGSADKQTFSVEKSRHVITRDAAKDQVFQAVADFIRRNTNDRGGRT